MKKFLIGFGSLILVLVLVLYVTGNKHILTGIKSTYLIGKKRPDIDDFKYFSQREMKAENCQSWPKSQAYLQHELSDEALAKAEEWETTCILIFHKDSLLYERYWSDFGPEQVSNSFSMAKSFTSMAIGAAIGEGKIKSVNEKVSVYLPWLSEGTDADLTIEHLLQMRSNIAFGESYFNPFGYQAKCYFGDDLAALTAEYHTDSQPGTTWDYQGGNTVLLSMILEKATGQSLSSYFQEKIYGQIPTCESAFWGMDQDEKIEKSFSSFYTTPYAFARIGQLAMDSGAYNGVQLIPKDYMEASFSPFGGVDKEGNVVNHYGYQWWLAEMEEHCVVSAQGMRGQYVSTIPDLDLMVVRMGHNRSEEMEDHMKIDLRLWLTEAMKMIDKK